MLLLQDAASLRGARGIFEGNALEVYDASGRLERVVSSGNREHCCNYWISDGEYYKVQVLVCKAKDQHMVFRRETGNKMTRRRRYCNERRAMSCDSAGHLCLQSQGRFVDQKALIDASLAKVIGSNNSYPGGAPGFKSGAMRAPLPAPACSAQCTTG